MDPKSQALLEAVLELPEADRVEIAREIMAALSSDLDDAAVFIDGEMERLQEEARNDRGVRKLFFPTRQEEIEDMRIAIEEMRSGKVIPAEQVLAEVREILNEGREKAAKIQ